MPFFASLEASFGYGRPQKPTVVIPAVSGNAPAYYTSSSGYLMYQPGWTSTNLQLKDAQNISTATVIRTYSPFASAWTYIHDKDLDSNIYYGMGEGTRNLLKYTLQKGGTTVTSNSIGTLTQATTSVLGACYAPACMWSTTTGYGAFIIGGYSQAVLHVCELNQAKTSTIARYTVPWLNEVYGTEVIPKAASGFNYDYGVAYTRAGKLKASWTVDMSTKSWTNVVSSLYSSGVTGPANGNGMIYYPRGKPIYTGDTTTSTNRIAMNDTSGSNLYVWDITESGTSLVWNFNKLIPMANNGGYPYHMSQNAYNSVS